MKKKNKSKIILVGAISLACIAVGTVGFSAFLIAQDAKSIEEDITINIADVTGGSLTLAEVSSGYTADKTIRFDASTSCTSGTIQYQSETGGGEDLNAAFKVSISGPSSVFNALNRTSLSLKCEASSDLSTLASTSSDAANYVVLPFSSDALTLSFNNTSETSAYTSSTNSNCYTKYTVTKNETAATSTTEAQVSYEVEVKMAFGWGKAFLYTNPCSTATGDTDSDTALTTSTLIERLNAFKTASTNKSISLKITVS